MATEDIPMAALASPVRGEFGSGRSGNEVERTRSIPTAWLTRHGSVVMA